LKYILSYSSNKYFNLLLQVSLKEKVETITKDINTFKDKLKEGDYVAAVIDLDRLSEKDNIDWLKYSKKSFPIILINSNTIDPSDIFMDEHNNTRIKDLMHIGEKSELLEKSLIQLNENTFFDLEKHCIWKDNEAYPLSSQEYKILYCLCKKGNETVPSEILIEYADLTSKANLYVHINNIRKKIELCPNEPEILLTKFGVGYKLKMLKES